jgi:hypothetical protein
MSIPVIHQTDLFHPHADPDDHWDLACVYALAVGGEISLQGTVIDYPPNPQYGNPAVYSAAQMNRITGLTVPVSIGSSVSVSLDGQVISQLSVSDRAGIEFILKILKTSPEPVTIHIVGSCRDVALAGRSEPELFEKKCRAIYLNAGSGTNDSELRKNREYNVNLDPLAFKTIFDLPCPVYWLPCFHALLHKAPQKYEAGPHGSVYTFTQEEILPFLSPELQKYFLFMFERSADQQWLSYLQSPTKTHSMKHYGKMLRKMWCTAGFFHSVGWGVDGKGQAFDYPKGEGVFSFEPIKVSCDSEGLTSWEPDVSSKNRFLFTITNEVHYGYAMQEAMKNLLKRI